LDGGIEPARAFIERQFESLILEARRTGVAAAFTEDYKSALQEWLQSHDRGLPAYRLVSESGPAHRRRFEVEVLVSGESLAKAEGRSKKEAAQSAAKAALTGIGGSWPRLVSSALARTLLRHLSRARVSVCEIGTKLTPGGLRDAVGVSTHALGVVGCARRQRFNLPAQAKGFGRPLGALVQERERLA